MNTLATGDPTLDGFLAWINEGGKLTSVSAVASLAAVLRFVAIPGVDFLSTRYGTVLTGVRKIMAIHAAGVLLAVIIDFLTHSNTTISQAAMLGFVASNTAIGFHQTTKQAQMDQAASASTEDDAGDIADVPVILNRVVPVSVSTTDTAFAAAVTEAATA